MLRKIVSMLAVVVGSTLTLAACGGTCEKACNNAWAVCGAEYALAGVNFNFNTCVSICNSYTPVGACSVQERVTCEGTVSTCDAFRKCDECTK